MAKKDQTIKSTKKKAPVKKKPAKKATKKAASKKVAVKKSVTVVSTTADLSKVKKNSHLIKLDDVMTKNTHRFKKKKVNNEYSLAAFGIKITR